MIFDFLDGEASLEEELEKECQANRESAREKESFEEVISLLKPSAGIDPSPEFTERVMKGIEQIRRIERIERIEQRPVRLHRKIFRWIRSPLDVHLNWVLKWSAVFTLVFLTWAAVSWQNSRMNHVLVQVGNLEQLVSSLKNQAIPTHFLFYSPAAESVHLVGSFNHWQVEEPSRLVNLDGVWCLTIPLKPGQYEYMFLVDGKKWVTDPLSMYFYSDGFGHKNSVVEVSREI